MADDFENEENQNVIIDCDILEAAKENIQPLAGGRRVTALASVLVTPHGLRNVKLEAAKARHRERVREAQARVDKLRGLNGQEEGVGNDVKGEGSEGKDEDEDDELTMEEAEEALLDAYVRLVTWTVEHYPRGQSAQSGILELLEEATRVMRHSDYAKADARYLSLWSRYASYVDHPELIYEFLLANEIGTKWGKLYEEYAAVLEKKNRRPKADEIYLLGIARKAEPLDHLERRHHEFQRRMMVAAPVPGPDSTDTGPTVASTSSNIEPPRRILADSTSTCTGSSTLMSLNTASSTSDVFSAPTSASSLASLGSQSRLRPNGKMPVFIDPTGEAESAPGNAWPELGTRAERIKENRRVPEKMQGAVLKQRGAAKAAMREASARARAAPKVVPYRDPELSGPSAPSGSNKKIEIFKDSGPTAASSSSNEKFVPFKDSELQDMSEPAGKNFVPYKDPEVSGTAASTKAKIQVFKDPEPPTPIVNSSESSNSVPIKDPQSQSTVAGLEPKFVPFKGPEPAAPSSRSKRAPKTAPTTDALVTPRRSARLNPKRLAKGEPESTAVSTTEEERQQMTMNPKCAAPAQFVPFKDEDAGKVAAGISTVRETAMRPKVLSEGSLGSAKATSEAEALRKDPFKNYKDL